MSIPFVTVFPSPLTQLVVMMRIAKRYSWNLRKTCLWHDLDTRQQRSTNSGSLGPIIFDPQTPLTYVCDDYCVSTHQVFYHMSKSCIHYTYPGVETMSISIRTYIYSVLLSYISYIVYNFYYTRVYVYIYIYT